MLNEEGGSGMLTLYGHPFSSYCQKVVVALYEMGTPFTFRTIDLGNPASAAELERLWPLRKFPVLVDGETSVCESSIIIEYLDLHYPGETRLIPDDPKAALDVRFMDRFFDNHVHAPMQAIVADAISGNHNIKARERAHATLETAYGWLQTYLEGRQWAAGDTFNLADCAAAPALFYADWVHPIGESYPYVSDYRARLNAHMSFARAIDEARPFRGFFPLGAPDRD